MACNLNFISASQAGKNPEAPPLGDTAIFVVTKGGIPYIVDKHGNQINGVKSFSVEFGEKSLLQLSVKVLVPNSGLIEDGDKGVVYSV